MSGSEPVPVKVIPFEFSILIVTSPNASIPSVTELTLNSVNLTSKSIISSIALQTDGR